MSTRRPGSSPPDESDVLIEAAVTAFRERTAGGRVQPSPAWWDLTPAQCDELFARQLASRALERILHPEQRSSTARAVLDRAGGIAQLAPDDDAT